MALWLTFSSVDGKSVAQKLDHLVNAINNLSIQSRKDLSLTNDSTQRLERASQNLKKNNIDKATLIDLREQISALVQMFEVEEPYNYPDVP